MTAAKRRDPKYPAILQIKVGLIDNPSKVKSALRFDIRSATAFAASKSTLSSAYLPRSPLVGFRSLYSIY